MASLKIFWNEKNDVRRVSLRSLHETLLSNSDLSVSESETLNLSSLREYIFQLFPDAKLLANQIQLFYTDEDNEKVCISTEEELKEALLVMKELTQQRDSAPIYRIYVETHCSRTHSDVNDKLMHMRELLEAWKPGIQYDWLKTDLSCLLNNNGAERALIQILSDENLSALLNGLICDAKDKSDSSLRVEYGVTLDDILRVVISHCPQCIPEVTRIAHYLKGGRPMVDMSDSGYFECVSKEEVTQVEQCDAVFEGDVTCPDGTVLPPKHYFDKIWRIRNAGQTRWPENTRLSCVGGDSMQALESVIVPAVAPGNVIDVCIRMLSPERAGRYTGYWRLSTPEGVRFGHRFWVDVNVRLNPTPKGNAVDFTLSTIDEPMKTVQIQVANDDSQWDTQVDALKEMGFGDCARTRMLLAEHNGDLHAVINALL